MSTDYDACCFTCKSYIHIGQRFASGRFSFGYGPNDQDGRESLAAWLLSHLDPLAPDQAEHDIRILSNPPDGFARDEYVDGGAWRRDDDDGRRET